MSYFDTKKVGDVLIIKLNNDLTFYYSDELVKYLKEEFSKNIYKIILNMSDVKWIDSVGLGILAMAAKTAILNETRVCLISPKEHLYSLLNLSGITPIVEIFDDEQKALQYLNK